MTIILGFVGQIASGKGLATDYFRKKYSAGSHRFSTSMRDVVNRLFIEENRENLQLLSRVLRENFGQDLFAKVIFEEVKNDPAEIICVDGIRRPEDIAYLKQLPNFILIQIIATPEIRFERVKARAENTGDKNKTWENFLQDQQAETELTIAGIASQATETIDNNGTVEEFEGKLDELIKKYN